MPGVMDFETPEAPRRAVRTLGVCVWLEARAGVRQPKGACLHLASVAARPGRAWGQTIFPERLAAASFTAGRGCAPTRARSLKRLREAKTRHPWPFWLKLYLWAGRLAWPGVRAWEAPVRVQVSRGGDSAHTPRSHRPRVLGTQVYNRP